MQLGEKMEDATGHEKQNLRRTSFLYSLFSPTIGLNVIVQILKCYFLKLLKQIDILRKDFFANTFIEQKMDQKPIRQIAFYTKSKTQNNTKGLSDYSDLKISM